MKLFMFSLILKNLRYIGLGSLGTGAYCSQYCDRVGQNTANVLPMETTDFVCVQNPVLVYL